MNLKYTYTLYDVTVTTLTPLHIGTGHDLMKDFDYVVHNRKTWRLDENVLLEAKWEGGHGAYDKILQARPPAELLDLATDLDPARPWVRYVIDGEPRSKEAGALVREQIKDAHDRPYLPGSSLKGALRTVLAWHGWRERGLRPDLARLGDKAKFAAQNYEHELFGPDPNHDLLRTLQVSDSAPVDENRLMLVNAKVVTRGGQGSPIEVEAIKPETAFTLAIKIDEALFSDWATQHRLRLGGSAEWLHQLIKMAQQHATERIKQEYEWFAQRQGAESVRKLYQTLRQARPDGFLLQLGWGGGWSSKTLGSHLSDETNFMEAIISKYKMARGRRQRGDPFPKSRRVTMELRPGANRRVNERIRDPLGWVLVEMKPHEGGTR